MPERGIVLGEVGRFAAVTNLSSLSCALLSFLNPRLSSAAMGCRSEGDQGSAFVLLCHTAIDTEQSRAALENAVVMLSSSTKTTGQPVVFSCSLGNAALKSSEKLLRGCWAEVS